MILCEGIAEREYSRALHLLRRDNPAAAWGLTFRPEGDKYLFPEHGVYVCLKAVKPSVVEVTGCFRVGRASAVLVRPSLTCAARSDTARWNWTASPPWPLHGDVRALSSTQWNRGIPRTPRASGSPSTARRAWCTCANTSEDNMACIDQWTISHALRGETWRHVWLHY